MTLDDKAKPNTSETMVCIYYDLLDIQCTYFHQGVQLVGTGGEDSDSDSEPVMDMDEYEEEDDPVSVMISTYHKCLDVYLTLCIFNPSLK